MSHAIRARGDEVLSRDQLHKFVPALFADQAHDSRSDRYVYLSSTDVLDRLEDEGFHPVYAAQSRSRDVARRDFTKHMIRFRQPGAVMQAIGDVAPEAVLVNSHDGTSSWSFHAGLFRLVCLNGAVVADAEAEPVRVRHSGDRDRILNGIVEGTFRVLEEAGQAVETSQRWALIKLAPDEQLAFAESAHHVRFSNAEGNVETPIEPRQLLHPRRSADTGDDLWRTFNRVQENVIRGGLSAVERNGLRRRRTTTREITGIDQDVKLNRALWALAERMAELKNG
jgi:hypothetical protein